MERFPVKVLLINLGFGPLISRARHHRPWPPLDLLSCTTVVREGSHQVTLLDLRTRPEPEPPEWLEIKRIEDAGILLAMMEAFAPAVDMKPLQGR